MNKLVTSTALALLLTGLTGGAAMAQSMENGQQSKPSTKMEAAPNAMAPSSAMKAENVPDHASKKDVAMVRSLPSGAVTLSKYYRKDVYDAHGNEIGDTNDLLVDDRGHITTAIIGVGGFLGVGEKNVAVPFTALHLKKNGDDSSQVVLDTTKTALEQAPGYTFDDSANKWVPAKKNDAG
jgi:sporulation protein YlmC with PRC-barrel domain